MGMRTLSCKDAVRDEDPFLQRCGLAMRTLSCKDAVGDEDPFFKRKGPPPNPLSKRTTRVRCVRTALRGAVDLIVQVPSPREQIKYPRNNNVFTLVGAVFFNMSFYINIEIESLLTH